jgi:hypothetical protein
VVLPHQAATSPWISSRATKKLVLFKDTSPDSTYIHQMPRTFHKPEDRKIYQIEFSSRSVLLTAPYIPAGMTGIHRNPPEWDWNPQECTRNFKLHILIDIYLLNHLLLKLGESRRTAGDGAAEQGWRDGIGTGASQGKDLASAYVLRPRCRIMCPYLERGRQR